MDDFERADGYTWKGYHDYVKLGFTLGFITGADKAIKELDPFIRKSSYEGPKVEELLPIYNITNTQLKERLDAFYSAPENMTVPIQNAVLIICKEMHPQKDAKMIAREIELERLPPEKQKLEKVKDYLKGEIQKGEYPKYEVKQDKIVESQTQKEVPLKTEEEVTNLRYKMLVPTGGVEVKEVVKVDYTPAIWIGAISFAAIAVTILLVRRRLRVKQGGK
jgi:hypothetical protein